MKYSKSIGKAMEHLGIQTLRKHQMEPIRSIQKGTDTLVIAPTGAGKSVMFQVPALVMWKERRAWTLVIEPTVSLMVDQVTTLNAKGISAGYISQNHPMTYESITYSNASGTARPMKDRGCILYVTPERLESPVFRASVALDPPGLVVVDEAHCVLDWGYTFRSSYLKIADFIDSLKKRPVVAAFTATAPETYRQEICSLLGMKKPEIFVNSLARHNLILLRQDCAGLHVKKKLSKLKHQIKKYAGKGRVVVYCSSRKYTDLVTNYLTRQFPGEVAKCHGYMEAEKRQKQEMKFLGGKKRIMIATTAFGMGVNVPDIRLVIHFNPPLSVIDYYQQIGRAGRDGETARAVLFDTPEDWDLNESILNREEYSGELRQTLLERMGELRCILSSDKCIMQQVLTALGEEKAKTCRHCTNCQRKRGW